MNRAQLTEPFVKQMLHSTLQNCHGLRVQYYNLLFNVGVFVAFVTITTLVLYYSYKKPMTKEEKQHHLMREQQYILSKIRFYKDEMHKKNTTDITTLPVFR